MLVLLSIGRSRRRSSVPTGLPSLLVTSRGSVSAVRAAPPASSGTRERPMRPPTAQAAALGLCCLLAGQPLSPRAARGSLFVARRATPASNATRGRPLVPQTTQAAPKCERACRSTAPKTRPVFRCFGVCTKCLDFEGALGGALDNCSQAAPAFISCFGIAAFGSLETRAARRSCACNRADIRALQ